MWEIIGCTPSFDKMSQRSTVSWTRIIAGYAHNGLAKEALSLFYQMHCEGVRINTFTFVSIVKAMVEVETLEFGRQTHGLIIKRGCVPNLYLESVLIDLYGKCGRIVDAFQVFDRMVE